MGRILREAQKIKERELAIDMLVVLDKIEAVIKREDISEEEKQRLKDDIIESQINKLKQMINEIDKTSGGKCWDFENEKQRDIFVEDDIVVLRGYREEDNDYIRKIKQENSSSREMYEDDEKWNLSSDWLRRKESFVCSIIRKSDKQYVGYISIKDSGSNLWEFAIELLLEQCNKGYGTRAVALFLTTISEITGKKQFQALVETDNLPSQRLMEKLGARLIDIYDYTFKGDEVATEEFEEKHIDRITDRMIELAEQINVEPRKLLSHVLDYRFFIENGKIVDRRR